MADDEWTQRGMVATAALAETWGSLAGVCHALVTQEWELPTECPGWEVKDQLSHLIGIERLLLGETAPEWEEPLGSHVKNEFAAMNEPWVAIRRSQPGDVVLTEFKEVTGRRLDVLRQSTPEEWETVGWSPVGEVPLARFMETRVFDSWVHEQDVRLALDRPGGMGGTASDWGIGQVQAAMGMVVGKKAKAPEGSVVRFVVTGEPGDARDFALAIMDGRARSSGGSTNATGSADTTVTTDTTDTTVTTVTTVTLTMSSIDFVRLGCGRAAAADLGAGHVEIQGDRELGQRVLDNMNFMF
jgi:uncharacterized protein (TIGR03083 family)